MARHLPYGIIQYYTCHPAQVNAHRLKHVLSCVWHNQTGQ